MSWRKFWSSLLTGLGGDKIAYLSDSGFDKYIERHWDNYPMDTIITELRADLGEPGTLEEFINGRKEKRYILDQLI